MTDNQTGRAGFDGVGSHQHDRTSRDDLPYGSPLGLTDDQVTQLAVYIRFARNDGATPWNELSVNQRQHWREEISKLLWALNICGWKLTRHDGPTPPPPRPAPRPSPSKSEC